MMLIHLLNLFLFEQSVLQFKIARRFVLYYARKKPYNKILFIILPTRRNGEDHEKIGRICKKHT